MSSVPHEPVPHLPERIRWFELPTIRDVWASLAITVMWVAVTCSAIWGPDFVASSNDGSSTRIPSGIGVALFAWLGTLAIAKYALRRKE